MVNRVDELGQSAVALTDHGNLHGAIDFYQSAIKAGIKPIIGVEGYVADGPRDERNPAKKTPFHLTLLAQNRAGYQNLLKLVTTAHLEGFYYRARMELDGQAIFQPTIYIVPDEFSRKKAIEEGITSTIIIPPFLPFFF